MSIEELGQNLDQAITTYEAQAGQACLFCSNDGEGEALHQSHLATSNALNAFKKEILFYLSQL